MTALELAMPTGLGTADLYPTLPSVRQHLRGNVDESMFMPLITAHMFERKGVTVHPQLYPSLEIDGIGSLEIKSSLVDRNGSIASLQLYEMKSRPGAFSLCP